MSVSRSRLRVMLCVLVGLLYLPGLFQAQSEQQAVVLLTEEEAVRLRLTVEQFEWQVEYQRGTLSQEESDPQPGPRIEFQSPAIIDGVVRTTTPLALSVAFKPNLAPVNGQSLKVVAKKGPFWKEITDIVLPYLETVAVSMPFKRRTTASVTPCGRNSTGGSTSCSRSSETSRRESPALKNGSESSSQAPL